MPQLGFMPKTGELPGAFDHNRTIKKLIRNLRVGVISSKLKVYDYFASIIAMLSIKYRFSHKVWPAVFVGWDNSPRTGENGVIMINSTPKNFGKALDHIIDEIERNEYDDAEFLFINGWNEWAEGNYLEPDKIFGNGFLKEVKKRFK